MLVVNEAFDCWERAKKQQDYHLYFKEWSDRDIASMVRRDRNHPSVVMCGACATTRRPAERVSAWGWPNEAQSWNWSGQEGKPLQVAVYSRCESVRLELNGKVIDEKPVSAATKLTAKFDVPYEPGELRAIGLINGQVAAQTTLRTSGAPKRVKLTADRASLRADRNDLSYVTVEIVDADVRRVPNADIPVRFSVTGAGELAAQGNGSPNTPASFRAPLRRTFEGRCLAILRPNGMPGSIQLKAEAEGLEASQITVTTR